MLSELKEVRNLSNKIQCTIEREDPKSFSNNVLMKRGKLICVFFCLCFTSSVQLWVVFFFFWESSESYAGNCRSEACLCEVPFQPLLVIQWKLSTALYTRPLHTCPYSPHTCMARTLWLETLWETTTNVLGGMNYWYLRIQKVTA